MKRKLLKLINGKSLQTLLIASLLAMSTFAILSAQVQHVHATDTSIEIIPDTQEFGPENATGQEFIIEAYVKNVTDLYGIDIKFAWDTEYLEYLNHTAKIPVEDFPDGIIHEPGIVIKDVVDSTAGTYWLAYASMYPAPAFDGTGIAFEMAFRIIKHPVEPEPDADVTLDLTSTSLPDVDGDPIPHDTCDGTVILHAIPFEYPPKPLLEVKPETVSVSTGTQFNSSVYIKGDDGGDLDPFWDVAGFDIYMNFRRTEEPYLIMEALNVAIDPDGSFAAFWPGGILEVENTINNAEGWIHVVFLGMPGVNGTHTAPQGNLRIFTAIFNATYEDSEITANITLKNPRSFVHRATLDADAGLINLTSPVGTDWTGINPYDYGTPYSLYAWTDTDGDGQLSLGDEIRLNDTSSGLWHRYEVNDIKGTLGPMEQQPFPASDDVWDADFPESALGMLTVGGGTDLAYDGYGNPYCTGNFSCTFPVGSVNYIEVQPQIGEPYNLTEGVDFVVNPDGTIWLKTAHDEEVINEYYVVGVNATPAGWPSIEYVASGISNVYVKFPNGTERDAINLGFEADPPAEWWYEPDYPYEVEAWWIWYDTDFNKRPEALWPDDTEYWVNYTAAALMTVDYNAPPDPRPYYVEFDGTYTEFLALGDPVGTGWKEVYPDILGSWTVYDWTDSDTSGDITVGDYLMCTGTVGNRTYLVTGKSTDIIVDQILTVDNVDQNSPFYNEEIIVGVSGFPHPERAQYPWHYSDSAIPIPHDVEEASVIIPEFSTPFALALFAIAATIIVLLIKTKSTNTKNNISSKQ